MWFDGEGDVPDAGEDDGGYAAAVGEFGRGEAAIIS